jgi:hypothetical protein
LTLRTLDFVRATLRVSVPARADFAGLAAFETAFCVPAARLAAVGSTHRDAASVAAVSARNTARIVDFTAPLSIPAVTKCRTHEKRAQDQYLARFS